MTRRTWIAIGLTAALLAAALLLPAWLVQRKDAWLLAQPRVTEAALSEFDQGSQGSLMGRIQLFASTQALAVPMEAEELLEARYGTMEEMVDHCIEELKTLFPMEGWSETTHAVSRQFWYYCDPGTGQSAMFAGCYLEGNGILIVYLDLESGRIVAMSGDGLEILLMDAHDPPGWDAWLAIWASYLGLELAEEPSSAGVNDSGSFEAYSVDDWVIYTDPEERTQQAVYFFLEGDYDNYWKSWSPYPVSS